MNDDLRPTSYLSRLRPAIWASAAALGLMLVLSAWAWTKIPAGARIATHWGASGQANGYAGKLGALSLLPLVMLGLAVLLALLPLIDPRRPNLLRSTRAYNAIWIGVAVLLTGLHALIVLEGVGRRLPIVSLLVGAAGVLFMVVGNYLPKLRSNWFAGVRTPWTLSSERSWLRTHRLAGRLFLALGLALLILAVVASPAVQAAALLGGLALIALVAVTYSWWVWHEDQADQAATRPDRN